MTLHTARRKAGPGGDDERERWDDLLTKLERDDAIITLTVE